MKQLFNKYTGVVAVILAMLVTACVDNDPAEVNRYANKSEMVRSFLENRSEKFSTFITILERAELLDLMGTYGKYTCLAPTNDAFDAFLVERGLESIDDLTDADCDTLAWTHIIKDECFITDLSKDFRTVNMNSRMLKLAYEADETNNGNLVYVVNDRARLVQYDDSVANGVVHTLDRVLVADGDLLPDKMKKDETISLFVAALVETHLADSLTKEEDLTYEVDPQFLNVAIGTKNVKDFGNHSTTWKYPTKRRFYFTAFVEPNEVYEQAGITNLEELRAYAKKVYDKTYPEDAGKYDNDPTNRKNPLNRFVAYHLLDRYVSYDELTLPLDGPKKSFIKDFQTQKQDVMEFYETMCPYTILKVSDAVNSRWINRRGVGAKADAQKIFVRGSMITEGPPEAENGLYHYIDRILVYDKDEAIGKVFNTRMRFDATVLSPDFMMKEDRARNCYHPDHEFYMIRFMPGTAKNFIISDQTFFGVNCRFVYNNSWEGDMVACLDMFDIKFRLPPVPAEQTYEVRLGYNAGVNRTVVQVYFDDNLTGDIPCDIPIDLRNFGDYYGYKLDADDLNNDEEEIEANDKAMRNQGFMKGPGAYCVGGQGNPNGTTMRDNQYKQSLRRILTTRYLEPGHDYYIRLRQVLENQAEMSLDYIELVPKSVYDGAVPEDRW